MKRSVGLVRTLAVSCALAAGTGTAAPETGMPIPETLRWEGPLGGAHTAPETVQITVRPAAGGDFEWLRAEAGPAQAAPAPRRIPASVTAPAHGDEPRTFTPRAAWVWQDTQWRTAPEDFVRDAQTRGLDEVYIAVHVENGSVADPASLVRLIALATPRGLRVTVVEGDPRMATAEGLAFAVDRARALRAFNETHPDTALSGLQYDIEPYILPAYQRRPERVLADWARSIAVLSETYGEAVDLVIPFWLPDVPGGAVALTEAARHARTLTVMAYRTTPAALVDAALPALEWAGRTGLPVTVAVEAGALADEEIHVYRRAAEGPLQILQGEDGADVRLHAAPVAGTQDRPTYVFSHAIALPASRISFAGDLAALGRVVSEAEPVLSGYPAFAGIAVHGLFETK